MLVEQVQALTWSTTSCLKFFNFALNFDHSSDTAILTCSQI